MKWVNDHQAPLLVNILFSLGICPPYSLRGHATLSGLFTRPISGICPAAVDHQDGYWYHYDDE